MPEQSQTKVLPLAAPEIAAVSDSRPKIGPANPAVPSQAKVAVKNFALAAEEQPTPEKAQQRYLKEHFIYIRDLITKKPRISANSQKNELEREGRRGVYRRRRRHCP